MLSMKPPPTGLEGYMFGEAWEDSGPFQSYESEAWKMVRKNVMTPYRQA
jgi:hypothetical protein